MAITQLSTIAVPGARYGSYNRNSGTVIAPSKLRSAAVYVPGMQRSVVTTPGVRK